MYIINVNLWIGRRASALLPMCFLIFERRLMPMVTHTISRQYSIRDSYIENLYFVTDDRNLIEKEIIGQSISIMQPKGGKNVENPCMKLYREQNQSDQIGRFIPFDLYESEEEYLIRQQEIRKMTDGIQLKKLYPIIDKYLAPKLHLSCFQQWLRMYVYPLEKSRMSNAEMSQLIVDQLIDVGWDPLGLYQCHTPEASEKEIDHVVFFMKQKWEKMHINELRNEMMKLFKHAPTRLKIQLCVLDHDVCDGTDSQSNQRKNYYMSYLEWLIQNDDRVFQIYYVESMRQQNHHKSMKMGMNEPSIGFDERVQRDIDLIAKPSHKENEFQNQGHNRLRKNIMKESVKPYDYNERKDDAMRQYTNGKQKVQKQQEENRDLNLLGAIQVIQNDFIAGMKFHDLLKKYGSKDSKDNLALMQEVINIATNSLYGSKKERKRNMNDIRTETTVHTRSTEEQMLLDKLAGNDTAMDLSNATLDDLARVIQEHLTRDGMDIVYNTLDRFDRNAKIEYSPEEKAEMKRDRLDCIREIVEDLINSQDPTYVIDGTGEPGCYDLGEDTFEDQLRQALLKVNNANLVTWLMERTTRPGYNKIKALVNKGKGLDEIREIVTKNLGDYFDLNALEEEADNESEEDIEYDVEFQDFIISLYNLIMDMDIIKIRHFMTNWILDEDAVEINRMIRNRVDINDICKRLFELVITDYNLDVIRMDIVEDAEPIANTNIDYKLVDYLLNDGVPPVSDEDELDEKEEEYLKNVRIIADRYPDADNNLLTSLYAMKQVLMESDIDTVEACATCMLTPNDARVIQDMILAKEDRELIVTSLEDIIVHEYDLDEFQNMWRNKEVEVHALEKRVTKVSPQNTRVRTRRQVEEERNHEAMMRRILGDNYDSDEDDSEEENAMTKGIHFFKPIDDIPPKTEINQRITDADEGVDQRTALLNLVRQEANNEKDDLEKEKDDLFDWMVENIEGVNKDELDRELTKMTPMAFRNFKRRIFAGVQSGKIKTGEKDSSSEEDSLPDGLGQHEYMIRKMHHAQVSSTDDEEDEDISDEEAERRFHKLLYSI